jgi:DNA repair ATPase RecN
MPTGYTCDIEKGISFKKYALDCARAFGALIEMRDESKDTPIPERFEPCDYHIKKLKEVNNKMAQLKKLQAESDDKIQAEMIKENDKRTNELMVSINKRKDLLEKYEKMLKTVESYVAPSKDHIEYKKFMRDQIKESIKFDCNLEYFMECLEKLPTNCNKWLEDKINECQYYIDYHTKENLKEIERVEGRNRWIKQLRESLEKYDD